MRRSLWLLNRTFGKNMENHPLDLGADGGGGATSGGIAVQHEDDAPKVAQQCTHLWFVQLRAHQRYHGRHAGLMHLQAIEEAFHDNRCLLPSGRGAMQVEDEFRFAESGRKTVARLAFVDGAPTISHQLSAFIVDGDHEASGKDSRAAIKTDAELHGGWSFNAAGRQIGMSCPRRAA